MSEGKLTGRLSYREPPLQPIVPRTEAGDALRRALIPETQVEADFSAVEREVFRGISQRDLEPWDYMGEGSQKNDVEGVRGWFSDQRERLG